MSGRAAVFLDRDGTLIHDREYAADADGVVLLPGAAAAVARVNAAEVPVIIVTNQSAIGRGLITQADYERVAARVAELLAGAGARADAVYYCPHAPDAGCACRKPGTALYEQAAAEHGLDLTRSWFIGDRWRDVAPAAALGGFAVLVPTRATPALEMVQAKDRFALATTLDSAVERALREIQRVRPGP